MTRDEWERKNDKTIHKCRHKLIFTNRGLNHFLRRQAKEDWILTEATPTRYYFEKGSGVEQIYTLDSKWLVNQRRQALRQKKIKDGKDLTGMNNDWELESVQEAEAGFVVTGPTEYVYYVYNKAMNDSNQMIFEQVMRQFYQMGTLRYGNPIQFRTALKDLRK